MIKTFRVLIYPVQRNASHSLAQIGDGETCAYSTTVDAPFGRSISPHQGMRGQHLTEIVTATLAVENIP